MNVWVLTRDLSNYDDCCVEILAVTESAERAKAVAAALIRSEYETALATVLRKREQWPTERAKLFESTRYPGQVEHPDTGRHYHRSCVQLTAEQRYPRLPERVDLVWSQDEAGWHTRSHMLSDPMPNFDILPRTINDLFEYPTDGDE